MLVVKRLRKYGRERPGSVAALGVFDGLHLGHRAIIKKLRGLAERYRHDSVVVTFDPPPQAVLAPSNARGFLSSLEEKESILERSGVDAVAVIRFGREVARLSPSDFVSRILVKQLRVSHVVCGSDCGFGRGRAGNLEMLKALGRKHGFRVTEVRPRRLGGRKISSTAVKKSLMDGAIGDARRMLGRPYSIKGQVVPGRGLGRRLGYPTLNIKPLYERKLIPASGVYAAEAAVGRRSLPGLLYIGHRPTLERRGELSIEFHSLGGRPPAGTVSAEVSLLARLRPEMRFGTLRELARAMGRDAARASRLLGLRAKAS